MPTIHPQYITDNTGKKLSAVLPMKEFKTLLEKLEELEDIPFMIKAKTTMSLLFLKTKQWQ